MSEEVYKIIKGCEIQKGDVVIHNHEKFLVSDCGQGAYAGSFDFGEYFWVKGRPVGLYNPFKKYDFWTYKNCPVIKVSKVALTTALEVLS